MLPDFLCIGAKKAGTSWLHSVLQAHPEIRLPPVKEIHYFDTPSMIPRILQPQALPVLYRQDLRNAWAHRRHKGYRYWYLRYFLLPRNDAWYASLFSPGEGQISGEFTPRYGTLAVESVASIHALIPTAKIIFLLRNPIDRTWSDVHHELRMLALQGQPVHEQETFIKRSMAQATPHRHSDYLASLTIWESFYPPEQLFVGFFEQIQDSPRQLLFDIYRFLGLECSDQYLSPAIPRKVNKGSYSPITPHWGRFLAKRYYQSLVGLHQRFNNTSTASWLCSAEGYLQPN